PEVRQKMRDYYETWWKGLEPLVDVFVPISFGARQQPVVELTSGDWEGIYADNTGHVRNAVGGPTGGSLDIRWETAGEYEFTLRRWPEQTGVALGEKYDAKDGEPNAASKAFPMIARAVVEISGLHRAVTADPRATGAMLKVKLPTGPTTFKAW